MDLICEKFTWRRGLEYFGASWLWRARLGRLGNLKSRDFFTLGRLRFLLTLRDQTSHILSQFVCVCVHMCVCVRYGHTLCGGFAIWSFKISIASSCGSDFFMNIFPSPFLHTRDKKQMSRQTKYYYKPQYEVELVTVVWQVQQKLSGRQAGAVWWCLWCRGWDPCALY